MRAHAERRRRRGHVAGPGEREEAPSSLTVVRNLQQTAGNRAAAALLGSAAPSVQRDFAIRESDHYRNSRDEEHSRAKTALDEADSDGSISRRIFGKHKSSKHTGKCVTTFKTSTGGYLVVVTYATLGTNPRLTYDTAFLKGQPPGAPESSAITYNPTTVIDLG